MKLKDYLKKHPHTITLYISEISEFPSNSNGGLKVYRMKLSRPLDIVHGSMGLTLENADEVFIVEQTIPYVKTFRVGNYNNFKLVLVNLYLDVSKPKMKVDIKTGEEVIDRPSKVWITHIKFSDYRTASRLSYQKMVNKFNAK